MGVGAGRDHRVPGGAGARDLSDAPAAGIAYGSTRSRWVLLATVLGSGVVFLDGTVVNVALPAIARDFHASVASLQWTIDAYLLTLSALMLLGGSAGDRYGRRSVFVVGLVAFSLASAACAAAPGVGFLIAARAVQGVGGALLVPGSLAIIASVFDPDDRGRAIGAWSGLAGVSTALGPFLGGWLIDAVSWRFVFLLNLPLAAVAAVVAQRWVPDTRSPQHAPLDVTGAITASLALAGLSYAAIERHGGGATTLLVAGAVLAVVFMAHERRSSHPMLPLATFRSAQFSGANLTTLAVYGALSAALFLVVLRLQVSLHYSALSAGAALVPFTVIMLALSSTAGRVAQRIGARLPMTLGPFVTAIGMLLFARLASGMSYLSGVLPATVVFGIGMSITVAPLTAAVLASVDDSIMGVASGINNAVARLAGLLAVAVLPGLAGIDPGRSLRYGLDAGYVSALRISAGLCAAGGVAAFLFVRRTAPVSPTPHPSPFAGCQDPAVAAPAGGRS